MTGRPGTNLGHDVALHGDMLVVGAFGDDDFGSQSGAAYIFERNFGGPGNWGESKKLTASDGSNADGFGQWVRISGDTLAVGAVGDDDNRTDSGSAYIFERNLGGTDNWGQFKKLSASDGAASDRFGASPVIQNDTVIVGSPE